MDPVESAIATEHSLQEHAYNVEMRARDLFEAKYPDYYDPDWDEVSNQCRARFRVLAKKELNI